MLQFALNHMTAARASCGELLDMATAMGCVGVELRNDLPQALFDGMAADLARDDLRAKGLRLLALAEVKQFNNWNDAKQDEARALMQIARKAGAEAVSLIPRNDGLGLGNGERQANLRLALRELKPMLEEFGLVGLVEPLGFEICALRHKSEAVDAIEAVDGSGIFKLVHDTFHHHLSGDTEFFPDHTGIVHISGVTDPSLATSEMRDSNRVLVNSRDRLGNLEQIAALLEAGFDGAISFEAFAPEVHASASLGADIKRSIEFIRSSLAVSAA